MLGDTSRDECSRSLEQAMRERVAMTNDDQSDKSDISPKRFGLTYDPPSIVLEYLQVSTGKLFHRKIGLRKLNLGTDASRVAEKMRQKNSVLLAEDKVSFDQLVSLVRRLQETMGSEEHKAEASAPQQWTAARQGSKDVARTEA